MELWHRGPVVELAETLCTGCSDTYTDKYPSVVARVAKVSLNHGWLPYYWLLPLQVTQQKTQHQKMTTNFETFANFRFQICKVPRRSR